MCRIFGYSTGSNTTLQNRMEHVSNAQRHGGPDTQAHVAFPHWGIGANRLAITDPAGGHQPYQSIRGIYACLNGEIYNHDDLRLELIRKGYTFLDRCDGSIIPALYVEYGEDFVEYLDGMFSIALIDNRDGAEKVLLATDCVGMKPLYIAFDKGTDSFVFSTEIPALLQFGLFEPEARHDLANQYMTVRAISDGRTFIEGVSSIRASSIVVKRAGEAHHTRTYVSRATYDEPIPTSTKDAGHAFRELLSWEISRLKQADAKVCSVNSGGLDSSLITMIANRGAADPLASFHVSCKGNWPFDERTFASDVALLSGGAHHDAIIDPQQIPYIIPRMVYHLGQPNAAPHALSAYCLFQTVGAHGYRVALTGEGSDELFCGYARMVSAVGDMDEGWPTRYLDGMAPSSLDLRRTLFKADYLASLGSDENQIDIEFTTELELSQGTRAEVIKAFEQSRNLCHYVLHRAEPLAMASGVEVRIPFCQPRVVDFSRRINDQLNLANDNRGKAIVYAAAEGILPDSVLNRPKQPFTLPVTSLMHQGSALIEYAREAVSTRRMRDDSPFDTQKLSQLIDEQMQRPSRGASFSIWAAIVYSVWLEQLTHMKTHA